MALGDKLPVVMGKEKAVAGGVATLDADGKLVAAQKPAYTGEEIPVSGTDGTSLSSALSNKADKVTLLGNVDCNTLFKPGDYIIRMDPVTAEQSVACNLPNEPGHWSLSIYATLEVTGNNGTVYVARNRDSGNLYSRQALNESFWPWVLQATATPPQIYELALLDGISPATPTDDNFYFANQMGTAMVKIAVKRTDGALFSEHDFIATLPEGFHPTRTFFAVLCDASTGRGALLAVRPDGYLEVFGVAGGNVMSLYGTATYLI